MMNTFNYFMTCMESEIAADVNNTINQQTSQIEDSVDKTVTEVTGIIDNIKQFIVEQGLVILLKLLFVMVIYFVAKKVKKILVNIIDKALQKSTMEASVAHFIVKLCDIFFSLVIVIAIVGYLGIDTSSLVALVGSAGLAVGLALQGSLSNFAGGVLILIMKPFKLGDYISTSGVEGTVTGIDIFYTRLTTVDNRTIVIPNGSLSNANIQNFSALPVRRVDLIVPVEYDSNLKIVKETLAEIAANEKLVLHDSNEHKVDIFVNEFEASDIAIGFRVWVNTADYWAARWSLMETIKNTFDEKGISIPFNQVEVNIISDKKAGN